MNTQHTLIALRAGQVVTLPNSRDHWLQVLQGRVWLTQSGDADDHFLQAGQRLLLGNHGLVVIEADGGEPARCSLQHAWAAPGQAGPADQPVQPGEVATPARQTVGKTAAAPAVSKAPTAPVIGKAPATPAVGQPAGRRISPA